MSPFGFVPPESSDKPEDSDNSNATGRSENPDNSQHDGSKNSKNPDFAALFSYLQNQMQSQFGETLPPELSSDIQAQFAKLGINPMGFLNAMNSTPSDLPIEISRELAKKFVSAQGFKPIGRTDVAQIREAMGIADLWLNDATVFPAHSSDMNIFSRADWVDATMDGWKKNVEPLAAGLALAMTALIEGQEMPENAPPIAQVAGLLRSFIGTMIATQLGQCIGGLASTVTGAHDVCLPLLDPARPALIPENIENWSVDIGVDASEVRIFHALREGAVARLFENNPWLVGYIRSAIADYGKGIRIDIEQMQRQAEEAIQSGDIDPNNPETFSVALNQGLFTPEESPQQVAALTKLETVLALIDGWSDDVTTLAAGDRLPSLGAIRETLRRRRATSSPAEQLFSTLFGLEVSPRMAREASAFWRQVRELKDIDRRDQIWSAILPTHEELLSPREFLNSVEVPDDLSGLV